MMPIHLFLKCNSHTLCRWRWQVAGSAPPAEPVEEKKSELQWSAPPPAEPVEEKKPEAELLQCVLGGNTNYVRGKNTILSGVFCGLCHGDMCIHTYIYIYINVYIYVHIYIYL